MKEILRSSIVLLVTVFLTVLQANTNSQNYANSASSRRSRNPEAADPIGASKFSPAMQRLTYETNDSPVQKNKKKLPETTSDPSETELLRPRSMNGCNDSITIELQTDLFAVETSWILRYSGGGAIVASGDNYSMYSYHVEVVCVNSDSCYDFTIYDDYGDGICCSNGEGFYRIYWNDKLVTSGGVFEASETYYAIGNNCQSPVGMCCYGYPESPICVDTALTTCEALGGLFDYSFTKHCATDPCLIYGESCVKPIQIPDDPSGYSDTRDLSIYSDDFGAYGKDVIYKFTLSTETRLEFSLCSSVDAFRSIIWLFDENECGNNEITLVSYFGCRDSEHARLVYDCPAGTYYLGIDASAYPPNEGVYTLTVNEHVACELSRPVNSILEGEPPCSTDYIDTYNSGCNLSPFMFTPYNCGDTVWGEMGIFPYGYDTRRDTDWYQFGLSEPREVSVTAISEAPFWLAILDAKSGNCVNFTEIVSTMKVDCDTVTLDAGLLPEGNYYLFVSPASFESWPCQSEYWFVVESLEPTFPVIVVTPTSVIGSAEAGLLDYATVTIANIGDDTLFYSISAAQGPTPSSAAETTERQVVGYYPVDDKIEGDDSPAPLIGEPYFAPMPKSSGGPDAFGYTWVDSDEEGGPTFGWIDISGVGTALVPGDDHNYGPFTLGFDVKYYGSIFGEIYICSNGFASFTSTSNSFGNTALPFSDEPNNTLAAFWDDLTTIDGGSIYYYADQAHSRFIISYDGIRHCDGAGSSLYFQLIINADGTIVYQYGSMNHANHLPSGTVGIENGNGGLGLQYDFNSNPPALHPNLAIRFNPPTYWLSTDSTSGTLSPGGESDLLEVTMDAENLSGGIYNGIVIILSNDTLNSAVHVPVTFYVGEMGTLSGKVTDVNTGLSVGEALVAVAMSSGTSVVDTTDSSGDYSLVVSPGDVDVTVQKGRYQPDSQSVAVVSNQTSVHDVALSAPMATIDTSAVVLDMALGDSLIFKRKLSNDGTTPLDFQVTFDFNVDRQPVSQSTHQDEGIAGDPDSRVHWDAAPISSSQYRLPLIRDFQDSVFALDLAFLEDDHLVGIEFDGTFFWITGGNSGEHPNKLYKLTSTGNLVATFDQSSAEGFGWRDLAWDGSHLWGSDNNLIIEISPITGQATGKAIAGPVNPCRALAYDAVHDWFWTANYDSDIYALDRSGVVQQSFSNSKAIYGLAWDNLSEGGPYLWVFSQDGTPLIEISQFNPSSGTYTGTSWQGALTEGVVDAMAGGACFTTKWSTDIGALFLLGQGIPNDFIYGYEIAPVEQWLRIHSGGSGTLTPGQSAEIELVIDFTDLGIVPDSTYRARVIVTNNDPYTVPEIQFSVSSGSGSCDCRPGDANGDGVSNISDVVYLIAYVFSNGAAPVPYQVCSGDADCSCNISISDAVHMINHIFAGGTGPCNCEEWRNSCETPRTMK